MPAVKNDNDKYYHHHHHNHIIHYHHYDADLSFQDPLTSRIWTRFALLLLPSLVADGRADRHLVMMVLMIMVQILLVLIIMMMLMTLPQPR